MLSINGPGRALLYSARGRGIIQGERRRWQFPAEHGIPGPQRGVDMNYYHLRHATEFSYDEPASESYNKVRLRPLEDRGQSCLDFRLTTEPPSKAAARRDVFGNWVHRFHVVRRHLRLRVEAESLVKVQLAINPSPRSLTLAEFDVQRQEITQGYGDFLTPTYYVPHLGVVEGMIRAAEKEGGGTAWDFANSACEIIHTRFRYKKGATRVNSSIQDALDAQAGVCQDFAHLLLAMVRMRGLPGRYVSGYVMPGSQAESEDGGDREEHGLGSHAWAEVFIPGEGWAGFDPTQGCRAAAKHIRVAYGRDYQDVTPVSGVYQGSPGQRLAVDVSVRAASEGEIRDHLQRRRADPFPAPVA